MEKAYKLLANTLNISNKEAKSLIDRGLVQVGGKRLKIARALLKENTHFKVQQTKAPEILLQDEQLLALNKPPFLTSEELPPLFPNYELIHRLDKESSGVILLGNEEFKQKAIEVFRQKRVYKEYRAIVQGLINEEMTIDQPILTHKAKTAFSKISPKGQEAITHITPLEYEGKRTLLKIIIETGRTHQIRVHLASIGHPIIGDALYGGKEAQRMLLHAFKISLLDYEITAPLPKELSLN